MKCYCCDNEINTKNGWVNCKKCNYKYYVSFYDNILYSFGYFNEYNLNEECTISYNVVYVISENKIFMNFAKKNKDFMVKYQYNNNIVLDKKYSNEEIINIIDNKKEYLLEKIETLLLFE